MVRIPAITDFRAKGTIMGRAGLTAVFGMGTGVTPPVWSPEKSPAGGQARLGTLFSEGGRTRSDKPFLVMSGVCSTTFLSNSLTGWHADRLWGFASWLFLGAKGGSAPIGVVKLLGC
jgi:hypothetical protein